MTLMKQPYPAFLVIAVCVAWLSQADLRAQPLRPVFPPMMTPWGQEVAADNAHLEYPRPQLVRQDWLNLNGTWDLRINRLDRTNLEVFTGKILVPFPVESALSGVRQLFTDHEQMQYQREFQIPASWRGRRIVLHFEAVDWEATVSVNGKEIGTHRGGYDHFSFDITDALKPEGEQTLSVSVTDPSDTGFEPHGKQMLHPRPPFFSPSSGIWQTVWLEPVPTTYIESLKMAPDLDKGVLQLTVICIGADTNGGTLEAVAFEGQTEVSHATGHAGEPFDLNLPHATLWSPEQPFLYDLKVTLRHNGQSVDTVTSYCGMRKISVAKDTNGYPRLMLNNRRLFELGLLDQGYWPDGIYTAPSDDALRYDVEVMKQLGFNMTRMHAKVESDRWYYWCDKLGLLVWQDMPNGDRSASPKVPEITRTPESAKEFEKELARMIEDRGNHPCIVMWIPFNQGWGQYDTVRITGMIKKLDPTRLVMDASGWYDMGGGDVRSLHAYSGPAPPEYDGKRACVEGECGGLALITPHHIWGTPGFWNVTYFKSAEALTLGYGNLMSKVQGLAETNGLSGAVVTQLADLETELDGFMTYDREVIKMPTNEVSAINERVIRAGSAEQ
jgi:hypothetical protein